MQVTNLKEAFETGTNSPPQMCAEAYRHLLERLVTEGEGYGKTKPVAAYKLRNIHLVTEKLTEQLVAQLNANSSFEKEQHIVLPDLYIVMDTSVWTNEYIRMLGMEDIASKWARRIVLEDQINKPDFKGPGLWTVKKSSFEEDYVRRQGQDEHERPLNMYDPNPEAHRICLPIDHAVTIPATWGNYTIQADGTLAVRERDMQELVEALQSVRDGKQTTRQALYTRNANGQLVARFDVYGMEPEFLEDNYDPVSLHDTTKELMVRFSRQSPLSPLYISPKDGERLPLDAEEILAEHTFADIPANGSVFWARNGIRAVNIEDRIAISVNEYLAHNFVKAMNLLEGEDIHTDLLEILDPHGGYHLQSSGRSHNILSKKAADISCFEALDFWRRLSTRFAQASRGTIHVAAADALASSQFRLFECPAIMDNDKITDVSIITGKLLPDLEVAYIDSLKSVFVRHASFEDYKRANREHPNKIHLLNSDAVPDEPRPSMPKVEWAEWQKQAWFDATMDRLLDHFIREHTPIPYEQSQRENEFYSTFWVDRRARDFTAAKTSFVAEMILSLREIKRFSQSPDRDRKATSRIIDSELNRLDQGYQVLEQYPEILYFDEPITALESKGTRRKIDIESRRRYLTQKLGKMFLQIDETLSLQEKNELWGRYYDYDSAKWINDPPKESLGKPRAVEDRVRDRLSGLGNEIRQALIFSMPPPV